MGIAFEDLSDLGLPFGHIPGDNSWTCDTCGLTCAVAADEAAAAWAEHKAECIASICEELEAGREEKNEGEENDG